MKDYQIIQEMYHKINSKYGDDLNKVDLIFRDKDIYSDICDYIEKDPEEVGWVYPAKSYIVAICYAQWISMDFSEDFYELLDSEDLLYGNDPYFVRYSDDKELYDKTIEKFGRDLPNKGVIPHIRKFYKEEFMITD